MISSADTEGGNVAIYFSQLSDSRLARTREYMGLYGLAAARLGMFEVELRDDSVEVAKVPVAGADGLPPVMVDALTEVRARVTDGGLGGGAGV